MIIFVGQSLNNKTKVVNRSKKFPVAKNGRHCKGEPESEWQCKSCLCTDRMIAHEDYGGTCMNLHT